LGRRKGAGSVLNEGKAFAVKRRELDFASE
jgi:hypothetical protein